MSLPVVWMVCSRPEYHIKWRFYDNDSPIDCWKIELPIDSKEAKDDIALFVRSSFKGIRKKHLDIVGESWSSQEHLLTIMEPSSGVFAIASTVALYVDDSEHGNPETRIRTVIRHLSKLHPAERENPMAMLDHVYTRMLSGVSSDILPARVQIIHSLP